jgi:hypothetical protein
MAHAVVLITSKIPVESARLIRAAREQNSDLDLAREVLGQRRVATELATDPEAYAVVVDLEHVGPVVLDHDPAVLVCMVIDAEITASLNDWKLLAHVDEEVRDLAWWTPPAHEGQMVTVSYALSNGYTYSRTVDASDRSTTYMRRPHRDVDFACATSRHPLP